MRFGELDFEGQISELVVDGGSTDDTVRIAAQWGTCIVRSSRGRTRQMNTGAQSAQEDILLFLHADSQLPHYALSYITQILMDPAVVGGRFRLQLD